MKPQTLLQIDFAPYFENGSWVVREESFRYEDGEALDIQPSKEWNFKTEEEADAFIDRWIKCKGRI